MSKQIIYLAGGCFWGMEELFRQQLGVVATEVGYTGGENSNPTYENHRGHAEALKVIYDDTNTTCASLLDFFFTIHDPTTMDRQGNDAGSSYRSAIFYQTAKEKVLAEEAIGIANTSGLWSAPVVTRLEEFTKFYLAEVYHQNYLQKHPSGYTCHYIRRNS